MMQGKISSSLSIGFILALSACNSGEEIPQKSDKEELEEIIEQNVDAVEKEAKSIKEAAAKAVKIIEADAQAEIDAIEPTEIETPDISEDDETKDNPVEEE